MYNTNNVMLVAKYRSSYRIATCGRMKAPQPILPLSDEYIYVDNEIVTRMNIL